MQKTNKKINCSCFEIFIFVFSEEKGIPVDSGSSSTASSSSVSINPLTGGPFSANYQTLLKKRVLLPVFEYRADFMRLLADHQCIVLVGGNKIH